MVTTYERDALGRVVREVSVREPEFSAEDVAVLLASRAADDAHRGSHGWLMSEATDPASEGKWFVPDPVLDFAQVKLDKVREQYRKEFGDTVNMDALVWHVGRRE